MDYKDKIKKEPTKLYLFGRKSSVGTTGTNNGFQPGEREECIKPYLFGRRSSVGTTDIRKGF